MTKEQRDAINRIIKWSTIPLSTMAYAVMCIEEGERRGTLPKTPICKDLTELGSAVDDLLMAFKGDEIPNE
jgi:hypothetical protein